jgi:hypothetical protein
MLDFSLWPHCQWDLYCSGTWHSVGWYLLTDVSGQPAQENWLKTIGPILAIWTALSALPVLLRHLPFRPSLPRFSTQIIHLPPLNLIVTYPFTFLFLSSASLSFTPLYFCLLALHVVILPYISARLRFFPRPIVLFWIYLFNKNIFPLSFLSFRQLG